MTINERIRFVLMSKKISQVQLAEHMKFELPKGKARISNQLRGTDTDSIKLITAVFEMTGANLLWLITGSGKGFDDQAMDETRLRTMDEPLNFIKKFQDKVNSMGGIDVLIELLHSNREKALREDPHKPMPAERENDTKEWIKDNLDYVGAYLLKNPDKKEELLEVLQLAEGVIDIEKTTQKKKKLTPPTKKTR